jgi:hypothetical protein
MLVVGASAMLGLGQRKGSSASRGERQTMSILSNEQIQSAKRFIFQNGRLLERQLFEYFFGEGTKQACVRALVAYQNADGGFGNGIEPDLLCPDSTAIGAETGMYVA